MYILITSIIKVADSEELLVSLLKNSYWSIISTVGLQIIVLIANIILARIISPEIFGLLGMVMVIAGLLLVFQEAGFGSYIIFEEKLTTEIISTTFWINVIISTIISIILVVSANFIANFYGHSDMVSIIHYVAVGLFFGSFGITARALLMKDGNFKTIACVSIIVEIISSILSIILALKGYYFIAVSSKLFFRPFFQSLWFFLLKTKSFTSLPSLKSVRRIFSYSSRILGSQIFIYLNNNVDYFLVGKLLGARSLGIYSLAYQWSVMARQYISGAVSQAAFPKITSIKHKSTEVKEVYFELIRTLSLIVLPICGGLFVVTPEFIYYLYGPKWVDAVPILQILLLAGAITAIGTLSGPVINGLGKPQFEMWLNIFSFILLFIMILVSYKEGLVMVSIMLMIRAIIIDFIKFLIVGKLIKTNPLKILYILVPSSLATLAMCLTIESLKRLISSLPLFWILLISVLSGVLLYVVFSLIINRKETQRFINYLGKLIKREKVSS
ncbi:lipopolysaccharide biosynthesis protein [Sporolactobacillus sp. THM7-7]|nr:lipopolysaccharide biosynthesis protein [Sporolactobacillus sp. THM7-7]